MDISNDVIICTSAQFLRKIEQNKHRIMENGKVIDYTYEASGLVQHGLCVVSRKQGVRRGV
jgi:hypothetical protein